MKPGSPKLFFIRAILGSNSLTNGHRWKKSGENSRLYKNTMVHKSMDWSICKRRKGTPNEIFRAEFQELVNEKFNDHTRIYSDGSNKEEKVGYAVVTDQHSTRRRIRDQSSIFSAIQKLPTTVIREVIFTNSLRTTMAASENNHTKNSKTRKIRQLMDKRKGIVTLC
jgi:hypothetical protein